MAAHASLCTPSSFERWSHCTASPRFELNFPEPPPSVYAEEGTLAHRICELFGKRQFTEGFSEEEYQTELAKAQADPLYKPEMLRTAEVYLQYLKEKAVTFPATPYVAFEVQVDLSDYIPECFGTCDCIMFGGDTLHITDYKHGQHIPVSAIANGQMRLYALGALKKYFIIFGDAIKRVSTAIVQPRVTEEITEDLMTVEELLGWWEALRPTAEEAYNGPGTFCPGEHCRFCRGKDACRARGSTFLKLDEYRQAGQGKTPSFSYDEIADILNRGDGLVEWYNGIKDYATQLLLRGEDVPGWKVVEGKMGNRAFTNADEAFQVLAEKGVEPEMLYERRPKSLAEIEKMVGKKRFGELAGAYVTRAPGKPTLVTASDPRERITSTPADDFADIETQEAS